MTAKNPINPSDIVQLHVHSEFSLERGMLTLTEIVDAAVQHGHKAIALTDYGTLAGAVSFSRLAQKAGIKPIVGMEITHEPLASCDDTMQPGRLVLIAKNMNGFSSLCRILHHGSKERPDQVVTVPEGCLMNNAAGLIALSHGLNGEFGQHVKALWHLSDNPEERLCRPNKSCAPIVESLKRHVRAMTLLFGHNGYFIELIDNNGPDQKKLLPLLAAAAGTFALPIVAGRDVQYAPTHSALHAAANAMFYALKHQGTFAGIDASSQECFGLPSPSAMAELYAFWPEALANTTKIAALCEILTLHKQEPIFPAYPLTHTQSAQDEFEFLAGSGLRRRSDERLRQGKPHTVAMESRYYSRFRTELAVISASGLAAYFLVLADIVQWSRSQTLAIGPGRGSAPGSLILYALGIVEIDPLDHGLSFERFMNHLRPRRPEVILDFSPEDREKVIEYAVKKYGRQNVANTRRHGSSSERGTYFMVSHQLDIDWKNIFDVSEKFRELRDVGHPNLTAQECLEFSKDSRMSYALSLSRELRGRKWAAGTYSPSIVIAREGWQNQIPAHNLRDSSPVIDYDNADAEEVGLLPLHFLGIADLGIIKKCVEWIKQNVDGSFAIENVNVEDPNVYGSISSGDTERLFRLNNDTARQLLSGLQPSCFNNLVAAFTLARPGPLGNGMADDFIARRHGRQAIEYLTPGLVPILGETYGLLLYQEQVELIATTIGGYSPAESDLMRRTLCIKKPLNILEEKTKFLAGACANDIELPVAEAIFAFILEYVDYGFNKAHAVAYCLISYWSAWLTTYYRDCFSRAWEENRDLHHQQPF